LIVISVHMCIIRAFCKKSKKKDALPDPTKFDKVLSDDVDKSPKSIFSDSDGFTSNIDSPVANEYFSDSNTGCTKTPVFQSIGGDLDAIPETEEDDSKFYINGVYSSRREYEHEYFSDDSNTAYVKTPITEGSVGNDNNNSTFSNKIKKLDLYAIEEKTETEEDTDDDEFYLNEKENTNDNENEDVIIEDVNMEDVVDEDVNDDDYDHEVYADNGGDDDDDYAICAMEKVVTAYELDHEYFTDDSNTAYVRSPIAESTTVGNASYHEYETDLDVIEEAKELSDDELVLAQIVSDILLENKCNTGVWVDQNDNNEDDDDDDNDDANNDANDDDDNDTSDGYVE